jgi:hypothetical protein
LATEQEIESALKSLQLKQEEIIALVRGLQKTKPEKDVWDKLTIISTFVSGVLLVGLGTVFTIMYNSHQATLDDNIKQQQIAISKIQSVAAFNQYLMGDDDVTKKRSHALQILAQLPDKDLAKALTTEFPEDAQIVAKSLSSTNHPDLGKNIAKVSGSSSTMGHTVLFDGFRNYTVSGFHFGTKSIVSWGSTNPGSQPDIEVANPGGTGSKAVFFLEMDTPPYSTSGRDFSGGKTPANAGIVQMSQSDLKAITAAPQSGWVTHYFTPQVGATYCVRTWDGNHFAKIKVTDIEQDQIGFDWVFQPSGSSVF